MLIKLMLIAVGGGTGSVLRYLIAGWLQRPRTASSEAVLLFPVGTWAVNVIGSLLIGVMAAAFFATPAVTSDREEYRMLLIVGLLGGFTTFSTFSHDTFLLFANGQWERAGFNIVLTNTTCLLAVWGGYRVAERLVATFQSV